MNNLCSPKRVESGPRAIGTTIKTATSGYPALGCSHRKSGCSGRLGFGDGATVGTRGTMAIGAPRSDFMAALTTGSVIPDAGIQAGNGKVSNFITTPP